MKLHSKIVCSLGALLFGVLGSGQLKADSVYTGTLSDATKVFQQDIALSSAGTVTIYTTSYGGGMNLDGTTAPAGGFQPNITLYNSDGTFITNHTGTPPPMANPDPTTQLSLDGYLTQSDLMAGSYIVTLTNWNTQQAITATNLSDGFVAGSDNFNDVQGNTRTGSYTLNVVTPVGNASAVPEPASFWLVLPALAGAALLARRRNSIAS